MIPDFAKNGFYSDGEKCCHNISQAASAAWKRRKSMQWSSPDTSDDEEGCEKGMLLPWKYAARAKCLTWSPVRQGVVVCMDLDCGKHRKGAVVGEKHHGFDGDVAWASDLEWVVINSFGVVEPTVWVNEPEFHNWTQTELYCACHGTDRKSTTTKMFFGKGETACKMRLYVASYEGAAYALGEHRDQSTSALRIQTLEETIAEWSNGVDPVLYVIMMKKRLEWTTKKMSKLKNHVSVWKWEAEKSLRAKEALERKVKFLNKR